MSINFDHSVPANVARVLDLAAQLGVLAVLETMPEMRQDLDRRVKDQADLMTRQELRVMRHAAGVILEATRL